MPKSETTAETPRVQRVISPRKRRFRRIAAGVIATVAILFAGIAGWGVYQYNRIDRVGVDLTAAEDLSPQNFLLVGSDTRELGGDQGSDAGAIYGSKQDQPPGGKRADTIIVARVDPSRSSIELLSVPRDLWIESPNGNGQRINSAYNDGAQALVDAIQDNLGIPINHYVEVDFNGFKGLVDALGGVPLYFDRPVRDSNTGLYISKTGCQTLQGVQALAFARSRHLVYSNGVKWITDETGDLGRITRQQIFLRQALGEVSQLGIGDAGSMRVLTKVAVNNVTLDDTLGSGDILRLSRSFSNYDPNTMVVHRLTTEPFRTKNGAAVLKVVAKDSQPVVDIFTGRAAPTEVVEANTVVKPADVTIDIENGSTIDGLAAGTGDRLTEMGFTVGTLGTGKLSDTTTVTYSAGSEAAAMLVASYVTPTPDIELAKGATLGDGHVMIRLANTVKVKAPANTGELPGAPATAPDGSDPSTTVATSGGGIVDTSATGAGTPTPEEPLGVLIGEPPPGVTCKK